MCPMQLVTTKVCMLLSSVPLDMQASGHEKALRNFACLLCSNVLQDPVSTPCGHHFCKSCLDNKFAVRPLSDLAGSNAHMLSCSDDK